MPRSQEYQSWLAHVHEEPWRYDFYQAMRRIASAHQALPPLGEALRPADEPVRVAQPAELDFAPAPLHSLTLRSGAPPRLMQRMFGLVGPNGALPLHLTEYARERALHHADPTFQRFLDTLTHRFALMFYRAWAEAQPAVSLDRRGNKAYFNRIGSLVGIGLPSLQDRDALPDASKLYFAGRLSRQTRDAEGLLSWIRCEFDVPAAIEPWCGHWMALLRAERSRLGRRDGVQLGRSAVLGGTVWDVQHKFRITIGPLDLAQYCRFLPGGADLARLQALVRHWAGIELAWDLKLVLARAEIPRLELGATPSLPDEAAQPLLPEGGVEVELVAVRPLSTEFGERVGLVLRVMSGDHAGTELIEAVAPRASLHSRVGELLRALAAAGPPVSGEVESVASPEADGASMPGAGLGVVDVDVDVGDAGVAAAVGHVPSETPDGPDVTSAVAGRDEDEPEAPGTERDIHADAGSRAHADAPAQAVAPADAGVAEVAEVADVTGDHANAADSRSAETAAGADDVARAVPLVAAPQLIRRRCRVSVHQQRRAAGGLRHLLGTRTGLGHTTWLGRYRRPRDADDLRLDVERPCAEA